MNRPTRDQYFLSLALMASRRSTCDRASVGAVIVKDNRVITTGYNGAPAGMPHCDEIGHVMKNGHCAWAVHAELNAIFQAAITGISIKGATLYVTHRPCFTCAKALVSVGIVRVVYLIEYDDWDSRELLNLAGIDWSQYHGVLEIVAVESAR